MTVKLIKMSSPGWIKEFDTDVELQQELYKHICQQCRAESGITEISNTDTMFATACGCEYDYDD